MAKKGKLSGMVAKSAPIPVKIISEPSTAYPKESAESKKWKAEDALRDIERAKAHERDKALMKDVKALAREKVNSLKKIC